ncbi:MAG TPA: ABC transporter permease, partial [Rhodothermales bacterium]|nr:ABC transporter permease [Rhodothermales bacterium]
MESQPASDVNGLFAAWRGHMAERGVADEATLDELESHLRDEVDRLLEKGLPERQAFFEACIRLGHEDALVTEYRKANWTGEMRQRGLAYELNWRLGMFRNYIKTAIRSLLRQKGYSFINVAGLTLGMACCLLLFQYVAYEYSFDQFNTIRDRIYRAVFHSTHNGEDQGTGANVGFSFGPTMAQEVPGIVKFARVHPNYGDAVVSYKGPAGDRTFKEEGVFYVDSTFLSMFTYPLVKGDRPQALRQPETMLVSASMARKYFGNTDPIGKMLDVTGWVRGPYTVTGVFRDVPPTSSMQFDFLLPMQDLLKTGMYMQEGADWGWTNFTTYVETGPSADLSDIERKITESYTRHRADNLAASNTKIDAHLQPLLDVHLNADFGGPGIVQGSRKTVYFFMVIGLITLLIALVNYVNLATARALDRAKEVGVRKVVGAHRQQLMGQFLLESALMNLTALVLAIVLALLLLPVVNQVADVKLTGSLWLDARFWAVFLGVFGLGALLSGLYPAFILSSFKPVTVLKGKAGAFTSRVTLRKVLVVVQFAASITLLAGTFIVYEQLQYVRGMDIGLDLNQVLVVEAPRVGPEGQDRDDRTIAMSTLKEELRKIPAVREIGLSSTTPGKGFNWYTEMYKATDDPSRGQPARATGIDAHFADVYGLEMVAGQPFHEGMPVPDSGDVRVLVNETMVKAVGFPSNEEAIGQGIKAGPQPTFIVQGVFKDFNWSSAHEQTEAVMFFYQPYGGNISMKVSTKDLPGTLASVQKTYEALFPGNPFNYYFADAAYDAQYKADERFATLFGAFAGIAILIACLGLFGLAAFTAESRTKEIGVRKVLGATVPSIVGLLSKDFVKLVVIALV